MKRTLLMIADASAGGGGPVTGSASPKETAAVELADELQRRVESLLAENAALKEAKPDAAKLTQKIGSLNERISKLEVQLGEMSDANEQLEGQVAELKNEQAEASEFEIAVNARMRPGLSREQATAAERRQREFNANKKVAEAEAKKAAAKAPAKK